MDQKTKARLSEILHREINIVNEVADLSWANLSWANLREANLRGANLRWGGVTGYKCAGWDRRGYHFRAVIKGDGIEITAGCRCFNLAQAREHWANNPDALARVNLLATLLA